MNLRRLLFFSATITLGLIAAHKIVHADSHTPRGYVIAEITVTDPEAYKVYVAAASPVVEKFHGHYLVRGGATIPAEGDKPGQRIIICEFESLAVARSFEFSPDYQAVVPLRQKAARSRIFLVEGVPVP